MTKKWSSTRSLDGTKRAASKKARRTANKDCDAPQCPRKSGHEALMQELADLGQQISPEAYSITDKPKD